MSLFEKYKETEILKIFESLLISSEQIYNELKSSSEFEFLKTKNESNDIQLKLDVFADNCFLENIKKHTNTKFIISEERPNLIQFGSSDFSLTLDPLDGSKSAIVGIPSGAIFGVFENVKTIFDFNGKNIVLGGFFVFGINLEVFFSIYKEPYKGVLNSVNGTWEFATLNSIPNCKMIAINSSNKKKWEKWLQDFYDSLFNNDSNEEFNMRWYASMVSEIKRLIIQGGLFSYPNDIRKGNLNGHLRLVYEAIPMSYLIETIGGRSSNGEKSLLEVEVLELHQKTPVFIGEIKLIELIEKFKKAI